MVLLRQKLLDRIWKFFEFRKLATECNLSCLELLSSNLGVSNSLVVHDGNMRKHFLETELLH